MNIIDVNLSELANNILKDSPVSADNIRLINSILFKNNDDILDGDIVMVFGNPTCLEDRIVKAVV